jgi:hypothetical protein
MHYNAVVYSSTLRSKSGTKNWNEQAADIRRYLSSLVSGQNTGAVAT